MYTLPDGDTKFINTLLQIRITNGPELVSSTVCTPESLQGLSLDFVFVLRYGARHTKNNTGMLFMLFTRVRQGKQYHMLDSIPTKAGYYTVRDMVRVEQYKLQKFLCDRTYELCHELFDDQSVNKTPHTSPVTMTRSEYDQLKYLAHDSTGGDNIRQKPIAVPQLMVRITPKTHQLSVYLTYFSFLDNGKKTIEIRRYFQGHNYYSVGDLINFRCSKLNSKEIQARMIRPTNSVLCKIMKVFPWMISKDQTLLTLLRFVGFEKCLPDCTTISEAMGIYNSIYSRTAKQVIYVAYVIEKCTGTVPIGPGPTIPTVIDSVSTVPPSPSAHLAHMANLNLSSPPPKTRGHTAVIESPSSSLAAMASLRLLSPVTIGPGSFQQLPSSPKKRQHPTSPPAVAWKRQLDFNDMTSGVQTTQTSDRLQGLLSNDSPAKKQNSRTNDALHQPTPNGQGLTYKFNLAKSFQSMLDSNHAWRWDQNSCHLSSISMAEWASYIAVKLIEAHLEMTSSVSRPFTDKLCRFLSSSSNPSSESCVILRNTLLRDLAQTQKVRYGSQMDPTDHIRRISEDDANDATLMSLRCLRYTRDVKCGSRTCEHFTTKLIQLPLLFVPEKWQSHVSRGLITSLQDATLRYICQPDGENYKCSKCKQKTAKRSVNQRTCCLPALLVLARLNLLVKNRLKYEAIMKLGILEYRLNAVVFAKPGHFTVMFYDAANSNYYYYDDNSNKGKCNQVAGDPGSFHPGASYTVRTWYYTVTDASSALLVSDSLAIRDYELPFQSYPETTGF